MSNPFGPLLQATDGGLYGEMEFNNVAPCCIGELFKFSNGISPSVQTVPKGGKAGQRILILGNHLTGTTSVTFNGMPAEFKVQKDSFITAWVPAGATTGTISVVTPTGTLNSNPQFVVTK